LNDLAGLLEPHIPALRRYARSLARDSHAADDLVQDCLERAINRWHLRRNEGDLRAWLFAILRNLFLGDVRQRKRRGTVVPLDDGLATPSPAAAAEGDGRVAVRDVLAALDALAEEQRSVLLLVGVEDLSYEQAARVLDVPVGTVMSRLSRGRERMRVMLESGGRGTALLRSVK
jgi:RNA polymerase sigma-70 factor (ECF subfamily)